MSEQARTEQLRKQELASRLDQFRKAQYDAENAENAEALENMPKVEDIVPGGWNASGRKRKKVTTSEGTTSGVGLKIRKMSSTLGVRLKEPTSQQIDKPKSQKAVEETKNGDSKEVVTSCAKNVETEATQSPVNTKDAKTSAGSASLKPAIQKSGGLLGLVTYSSDEDS